MQFSVYVTSIKKDPAKGIVVEACNGTVAGAEGGPPFVRFQIEPHREITPCVIGKRYYVTIAETLDGV